MLLENPQLDSGQSNFKVTVKPIIYNEISAPCQINPKISSTVLTLVVVPVVYSLLDDLSGKFSKKKSA